MANTETLSTYNHVLVSVHDAFGKRTIIVQGIPHSRQPDIDASLLVSEVSENIFIFDVTAPLSVWRFFTKGVILNEKQLMGMHRQLLHTGFFKASISV
jgi:hypothetical protein